MNKKTHLPIPVQKVLRILGKNIGDARRRRRIAMELMSERCGFSRPTLSELKKAIQTYLWVRMRLLFVFRNV